MIDGAALGHGLVNGPPDTDGVMRRVPLLARAAGALTPSFALELVRVAQGADRIDLEKGAVRIGKLRLPVDAAGQLALRFGDLPGASLISAADLLRSGVPANAFDGKIVLIGLTAAGTSDVITTPRTPRTYGVLVQAQAVDAILTGKALRRAACRRRRSRSGSACCWSSATGCSCCVLGRGRSPRCVAAAVVLAFAASWLGFTCGHGLLIDPAPMLAPGAVASRA